MTRQREQRTYAPDAVPRRSVAAHSSSNPPINAWRDRSEAGALLELQRRHGNAFVQRVVEGRLASTCRGSWQIARQPAPPDPGWGDAPKDGLNEVVTTVDDQGNIARGKGTAKGVWRIPIEDLGRGFQGTGTGPAFESPGGKAVALIPNIGIPKAAGKDKRVPVDVLLHLHGHGVGYRELQPRKRDAPGVLKPGQLRDVALYQMEQQLLSLVNTSNRFIVAVLAQGSEFSDFGKLGSQSDLYLKDVFAKLVPKHLPAGTVPGRLIVSGHSGGGPTAMQIAAKATNVAEVLLFDAINYRCTEKEDEKDKNGDPVFDSEGKPKKKCIKCASNEYTTARNWVIDRMTTEVQALTGTDSEKEAHLKANGTRFRGLTSASLGLAGTQCGYGHWYKKLQMDIEATIKKLKVSGPVENQLRKNYEVRSVGGSHETVMGKGNLEAALKV